MTEYEQAVERRARARHERAALITERDFKTKLPHWDSLLPEIKSGLLELERATLEADDAAGLCLVPKEATPEMIGAGGVKMFVSDMADAKPREAAEAIINAALAAGAIRKENG